MGDGLALWGPPDRFLTTAELGLVEAVQGLGVQGTGVGTECTLRQLQGVIPGPGQQPAQVTVTGQKLSAKVPARWVQGTVWAHGGGGGGESRQERGGEDTWGMCASCYSGYDLGAFSGSLHTQQARCRLEMTTYLAPVSMLSGELEFG